MTKRIPNVLVFLMTLLLAMPGYFGNTALAAVPITVAVADSPDPVTSGQILMYTWTITNTGGAKVTEVVGTTHVDLSGIGSPPQLVITSNVGSCTQLNGTVTCTAGTLQGGQVWTVTIRGLVNAPSGSTLNNTVTVTGTKSAQSFSVSASATTLVLGGGPGGDKPDLSIQKVGPGTVVQGDPFTYQLTVNNTGNMNASNVTVIDNLPAGLTSVTATGTSLFNCSYSAPTVTCVGGLVNAGSNATININANAPAAPFTGQIANNAVVDPFDTIVESNEFNNTSATIYTSVVPAPPPPPYTITKTQTLPAYPGLPNVVVPGDTVKYTIVATNISGSRSDYNVLSDATQGLEASSLTVSATLSGGGAKLICTTAAPTATCTWTQWPTGASITMIITGQVIASAGTTIRDTATIQGNVRNTGYSATTTLVSTVRPGVDLTITKSDSPDPVCASSWPPLDPTVLCSGGLTYTYVVGNSGIVAATGVTVRDPLPAGLIFDSNYSSTDGFTCTVGGANVLTCTGGTIGAQSTETITIVLSAPSTTGTITNTVTVDPTNAIFESDETNNVASQTTTIGTGIDLTILKTDVAPGYDPIATSGTQTYTITVDNIGPQDATNIRVRDALPAGTIFISATEIANGDGKLNGFTCSYSSGIVECINGHIIGTRSESYNPPGPIEPVGLDTATIIIKVFAQPIVGTMHNEVRVDPLGEIAEINENNNFDFEDTVVVTGDAIPVGAFNQLTIKKTQLSPANPVARNAVVTYDLEIENKGTDPAYGITVRDFLPGGSTYIEAKDTVSGPDAFNCIAVALVVTCNGGTLSGTVLAVPGVPTVRHITVKMFAPDIPGTYINQAIVDPDNTIPEGNEFDNISNAETMVQNAGHGAFHELTIVKTATPSGLTQNGTTIIYTLQVTNTGSDAAFQVVVKDFLPAGTTFVSAWDDTAPAGPQNGDFLCTYAAGVVTCSGGTLDGTFPPPDGPLGSNFPNTRTIKIQVTAANVASLDAVNQAFIDPDNVIPEGDETNNTSYVINNVRSFIDLTAKKTGGDSAAQSSTFEYELQAINTAATWTINGSPVVTPGATAYNVTLHDALPVGLIVLGAQVQDADNNDWQCQVQENPVNVVDCIGSLPAGTTVKFKIAVFVTATSDVKLINEACIDWLNTTVESDETNNCATAQTTVGAPDLVVTKSALNNPATPGQNQVFTINVVNIGNVDATSVTITDTLPSGLTYVSALGSNGFTCTGTATVTCTYTGGGAVALAKNGGSTSITLTAQVGATATGPITNSASATSVPADPNTGNNTGSVTFSVGGAGIDLQLLSAIDTPDPVQNAGILTYTIMVLNSGTADAGSAGTPVLVRSTIDSGLTTLTAVASEGFSCAVTGTAPIQVDCTNTSTGILQAGHTVTVTITGVVTAAAGTNITNEVKVDPSNTITETNETNNNFTVVTSVVSPSCPPGSPPATPCFDLVTSPLLASADPVDIGDTVTFTVTVTNAGNVDSVTYTGFSNAVYVEIDVPTQIDYTAASVAASSGFTCDDTIFFPALLCWGDLAAGSGVVMSFAGTVNSNDSDSIIATSVADPFSFITEFDESNNNGSVTITRN